MGVNDPKMSRPDWDRYLVTADTDRGRTDLLPVGDPTRWGATVLTEFVDQGGGAGSFGELYTPQILNLGPVDRYSRGWSLTGTVQMDTSVWDIVGGTYPDPTLAGFISINVLLEIVSGVGQARMTQLILLAASGNPTLGLCNQQAAVNNGPYGQLALPSPDNAFGAQLSRPFAAIGAIVGNHVSVRGLYQYAANEYHVATLTVIATPIAAGSGL
jgi:hypothetical protein